MSLSLLPVTSLGKKRKSAARLQKARVNARRNKKERKVRLATVVQPPSKAGGGYTLVVKNPGNFKQNFGESVASGDKTNEVRALTRDQFMVLCGTDSAYGHSISGVRQIVPFSFPSVSKEGEDWFSFKGALTLEQDADPALLAGCQCNTLQAPFIYFVVVGSEHLKYKQAYYQVG
jgi:hypothetical protein